MRIAVVGVGNMGGAILRALKPHYDVRGFDKGDDLNDVSKFDMVILAVKPQQLSSVVIPSLKDNQILISVLAGTGVSVLKKTFPDVSIVRVMPNLCASTGRSLNAYFTDDLEDVSDVEKVLSTFGKTFRISVESDFQIITPLFGSGPANVLYFMKSLSEFAGDIPLEKEYFIELFGATAEWASKDGRSIEDLIQAVTSKGGTTEAIHEYWNFSGFDKTVQEGLAAGKKREEDGLTS